MSCDLDYKIFKDYSIIDKQFYDLYIKKQFYVILYNKQIFSNSTIYKLIQFSKEADFLFLIQIFGFHPICKYQNLTENFILKYMNLSLDEELDWLIISKYYKMSIEFIIKFKYKLSLEFLLENYKTKESLSNNDDVATAYILNCYQIQNTKTYKS